MENLDLRKAVAEALGCKPKKWAPKSSYYFCTCEEEDHGHGIGLKLNPYELDPHAAIDALEEYARKTGFDYDIARRGKKFKVTIYTDDGIWVVNKSLALAICEAISDAAQKSEKEAGE